MSITFIFPLFAMALFSLFPLPVSSLYSLPSEDLEGSGSDLEGSGPGSGDWSEGTRRSGETHSVSTFTPSSTMSRREDDVVINAIDETDRTFIFPWNIIDDSDLTFARKPSPAEEAGSATGNMSKSKGILDNKDVLAGVIAGGVVGAGLALSLVALMIYRMNKKDVGGYTLGQQTTAKGACEKPMRKEQFVE